MSVPGQKDGVQGKLILTVDIEKDQTWSVEIKNPNDGNKILELLPSGGTLNEAACDGDFAEETIFNATHSVGPCATVGDNYEIVVAINNSASNVDASFMGQILRKMTLSKTLLWSSIQTMKSYLRLVR